VYTGSIPVLASNLFNDLAGALKKLQKRFHIRFHVSRFPFRFCSVPRFLSDLRAGFLAVPRLRKPNTGQVYSGMQFQKIVLAN